ncbi:hypothetical protein HDU93_003301 [Gonapodya sp. JEL0774]|nr:hypothetical protein HDU93_003301 [Gonapodya sp. JEL0774]
MAVSGDANGRLIDSIEEGTFDLLQIALRNGGDPNVRKRIVLKARYLLEKNLYSHEDKYVNGTDSQLGESALVLAIKSQRVDIVRALLEHGADPNRPVDWLIPDFLKSQDSKKWDQERWNTRWASHRAYPSALDFALFSGREKFNLKGPVVQLDNPSLERHVCSSVILFPNPDVIKVMLQLGAIPTVTAYEKAKRLAHADNPNPVFLRLLENTLHPKFQRETLAANFLRGGPNSAHNAARAANSHATLHTPDASVSPAELQRQLADLQQLVQEQRSRIEELEMENRKLVFEVAGLKRDDRESPGGRAVSVVPSNSEGDPEDAEGDVPLNLVQEQGKRKPYSLGVGASPQIRVPSPVPPQLPMPQYPQQQFYPGGVMPSMMPSMISVQPMMPSYPSYQPMGMPAFMPPFGNQSQPGPAPIATTPAAAEASTADYRQFMFRTNE